MPAELKNKFPGKCAKLKRAMDGTRDEARAGQAEYVRTLETMKRHEQARTVHASFTIPIMTSPSLSTVTTDMQASIEMEVQQVGTRCDDGKKLRMLSRTVRLHDHNMAYRADGKHARQLTNMVSSDVHQGGRIRQ